MMQVQWMQCDGDAWCELGRVVLESIRGEGVYIIWSKGGLDQAPYVVAVGKGRIPLRLRRCLSDREIMEHRTKDSPLFVTWAVVPRKYRDGVERFLVDALNPAAGARQLGVPPIPLNLPAPLWGSAKIRGVDLDGVTG